jgi:hypothetical protein
MIVHIDANHPAVAALKPQSLFASTYSRAGEVIAYDLAFPRSEKERLRALLKTFGP